METVYIFILGMVCSAFLTFLVWGGINLFRIYKSAKSVEADIEEIQLEFNNSIEDLRESLQKLDSRLDNEIKEFSYVIEKLNNKIEKTQK